MGKSSLFNRLVGTNLAIIEDRPGVTRDRHYAHANMAGRDVVIIDTGGFDPESDDPMRLGIVQQVRLALEETDLTICVLDASEPPLPADRHAAELLRQTKKPVIFVANKLDNPNNSQELSELYALGIGDILPLSALHGHGLHELERLVSQKLPEAEGSNEPVSDVSIPWVAIVGKPNAGKSSLINHLLGRDQQLVDARPGTTVDSIDSVVEKRSGRFVLIDTAGMRRKRSISDSIEAASVLQAIRALGRANVAVLMIDVTEGATEQDTKIAGLIQDRGCGMVVALNKTDLVSRDKLKAAQKNVRETLLFASWAPRVAMSVKDNRGTTKLLETIRHVHAQYHARVPTAELNRFFEDVLAHHPPPTKGGRPVRLYYVTQARTAPPVFVAVSNRPEAVHFSYQRYVINQIRERFGFDGVPIRVVYRKKSGARS
ncbi:MAG: ribosome biogenesis GTPase Der [Myxococcales bacterium]|nr:ribosome biogenesis GTPase Der [Myxococcales bacterium]